MISDCVEPALSSHPTPPLYPTSNFSLKSTDDAVGGCGQLDIVCRTATCFNRPRHRQLKQYLCTSTHCKLAASSPDSNAVRCRWRTTVVSHSAVQKAFRDYRLSQVANYPRGCQQVLRVRRRLLEALPQVNVLRGRAETSSSDAKPHRGCETYLYCRHSPTRPSPLRHRAREAKLRSRTLHSTQFRRATLDTLRGSRALFGVQVGRGASSCAKRSQRAGSGRAEFAAERCHIRKRGRGACGFHQCRVARRGGPPPLACR